MLFNQHSRVVGTFGSAEAAWGSFDRLVLTGFPLSKVILVGQDVAIAPATDTSQGAKPSLIGAIAGSAVELKQGVVAGNMLGGATGVLLGLGILALPGMGQVALTSAVLFTVLSGGVGTAAGSLFGALVGLGSTEKQIKTCTQQLARGQYLLIVQGTQREINSAKTILSQWV